MLENCAASFEISHLSKISLVKKMWTTGLSDECDVGRMWTNVMSDECDVGHECDVGQMDVGRM